ncbi:MAG: DUF3943 domain-containing protein [Gemmatimonadota bacterium]
MTCKFGRWAAGTALVLVTAVEVAGQSADSSRARYLLPAVEIVGFDLALNLFDRAVLGSHYRSNLASIRRNLRARWVVEDDPYLINQFGHPYQGATYHLFARSAGQGYWRSAAYTFAGSVLWEIAGETTPPSINDQIASGIGGSFLGEGLYRLSSLISGNSDGRRSRASTVLSTITAPPAALNRRLLNTGVGPAPSLYYRRVQLGVAATAHSAPGAARDVIPNEVMLEGAIEYGLPGREQRDYRRPFEHFAMQATASSANVFESMMMRGLLGGRGWSVGETARGVMGLYGSYDYIAPQLFRVSSTALLLGTTGNWWLSDDVTFIGTANVGAGYAAAGTNRGPRDDNYQYGLAPQLMLGARVIAGDAALEIAAREYYVSDVLATTEGAHDNIARAELAGTLRLWRQNGIGLRYVWSRRDSFYPELGARTQVRGTIGLFYTFLGRDRFGEAGSSR